MVIFVFSKIFLFAVDCKTEQRFTDDSMSACSGCGLNLKYNRTEVTIIIPGEHGGRDDCVEKPEVVEMFPCNKPACTTETPPTKKPKEDPGSFSQIRKY